MSNTCWLCGGAGEVTCFSESPKYVEQHTEECTKCGGRGIIIEGDEE